MATGRVEAYEVFPNLFIGPAPATGSSLARAGFTRVMLCAHEYQPDSDQFPGVWVDHCPMADDPYFGMSSADERTAVAASRRAADALMRGDKVLVSCKAGIDRSALVAALAIYRLTGWTGTRILSEIRRARPVALSLNPFMRNLVANL